MNEIPVYQVGEEVTFFMYGIEYRGLIEEHTHHTTFGDAYSIAVPDAPNGDPVMVFGWEIVSDDLSV